ncbi:hypothetical protein PISL3812_04979 [Talaromyces islandicus]|uniref:Aflatoxin regulatory protein domain-containing protein n=1 Tax=Talaromyces islandicus TaxID=28573 RepID=A0A0U1LX32_TALIS|nr:hypothetical protein PISL3812_04979 [Talaromyces islandicus]
MHEEVSTRQLHAVLCRIGNAHYTSSNNECTYSYMAKLGKPKGARNKKTLERLDQVAANSANATSSSDSLPSLSRSVEPERETSVPMTSPGPITPWMHWSALASTGVSTDGDLNMSLEDQNLQSLFDLDPSLNSGQMDRSFLQLIVVPPQFQMLTPGLTDPGQDPGLHRFPGSYNGSSISTSENEKMASEGRHPATTAQQTPGLRINTLLQSARESDAARSSMSQMGHLSRSDEDEEGESGICECLSALTDRLCVMNAMERKHVRISIDRIFSEANKVLDNAVVVLGCQQCRVDSKVLLMIITMLQTVFNWAMQEQQSTWEPQNIPAVAFGKWTISEEESKMVKTLLVDRVLTRSSSMTDVLRQRITHISHMANNKKVSYQVMDAVTLEFTLQRLVFSVREVIRCVKRDMPRPSSST